MKLTFYVHDLKITEGHTRVTIESLRYLASDQIDQVEFICYQHDPIERLIPRMKDKVKITIVPGNFLKIYLFRDLFFQVYCTLFLNRKRTKCISIGTAFIKADLHVIHFLQLDWKPIFFQTTQLGLLKKAYKKLLYWFFIRSEFLAYRKNKRYITVSHFLKENLVSNFKIPKDRVETIYNGFNLSDFSYDEHADHFKKLVTFHPTINNLDQDKPILLFIGALERKGINQVLDIVQSRQDIELIVIGKSSTGIDLSNYKNITHIIKTDHINSFLSVSDVFIFPTIYEPFGLVLIEAAVMGLHIYTNKTNVGASEILEGLDHISFPENFNDLKKMTFKKISSTERINLIKQRKESLQVYSWDKISNTYLENYSR